MYHKILLLLALGISVSYGQENTNAYNLEKQQEVVHRLQKDELLSTLHKHNTTASKENRIESINDQLYLLENEVSFIKEQDRNYYKAEITAINDQLEWLKVEEMEIPSELIKRRDQLLLERNRIIQIQANKSSQMSNLSMERTILKENLNTKSSIQ